MLLDIHVERLFLCVKAILEQDLHAQTGQKSKKNIQN